jgi:glutathione S-transferase
VAVLLYLEHHYDKENKFWFTDPDQIADGHQWLLFQASGVGPYFGQKVRQPSSHS